MTVSASRWRNDVTSCLTARTNLMSLTAKYLLSKNVPKSEINNCIYGIEKDNYLSKLAKTHISLLTDNFTNIFCGDSVERIGKDGDILPIDFEEGFDIVVANPPFGAKIKIGSDSARKRLDLSKKWSHDLKNNDLGNFLRNAALASCLLKTYCF